MEVQGRTVLVTGGAVRIGRAVVMEFASRGANVIVHARKPHQAAHETLEEAKAFGVEGMVVEADQKDGDSVEAACEQALARFGTVEVLVNNAASWTATPLETCTARDFDEALDVNLRGPWLWSMRLGLHMKDNSGGVIVSIGDSACYRPGIEYIPYSIAKAGIRTMTVGLAKALAPKVRVASVDPGPVLFPEEFPEAAKQPMLNATLLRRMVPEEEIARAVLYLATSESVTGETIAVDAGYRFGV